MTVMATKIMLDPGHNGMTDPGAVYEGRRESDDVLHLAMAVGNILSQSGYDVEYTRTGNVAQSVTQKAQNCQSVRAISLSLSTGTWDPIQDSTRVYRHCCTI